MINQRKAGATLSYVNMFLSIIVGFINLPLILRFVTKGDYGVYVIMGSLIAVMGVMDFGLAGTMTRYYTKSMTIHDDEKQENTLATGAVIYGIISLVAIAVGFILYPLLDKVYAAELTVRELVLAKQMFIIMMGNFIISISTNVFNSAIMAHEKFAFLKIIEMMKTILNPVLAITFLFYTKNIVYVVVAHSILNVIAVTLRMVYAFTGLKIKIKLHYFDKELFKAISAFAFFIFLNMIMDRIYWQTDNLILGAVAGTAVTAIYGIATTLNRYYLNFSSNIASVFLPKITAISSKTDDMKEINEIFIRIGRIQYIIIMLILSGFIIFGREFIIVWVGPDFLEAYYFSLIVMVPLIIPLIQNTGISILQAKNKHAFRSIVYVIIAALNVGASIPLAKLYGGYGCAAATGVSLLIGQGIIINIYYEKKIGLEIRKFFKQILLMSAPIFAVGIASYFLNTLMITEKLYILIPKIFVFIILYFLVVSRFAFNQYEKDSFGGFAKKILWRARK